MEPTMEHVRYLAPSAVDAESEIVIVTPESGLTVIGPSLEKKDMPASIGPRVHSTCRTVAQV